jgi:hypothetical protein
LTSGVIWAFLSSLWKTIFSATANLLKRITTGKSKAGGKKSHLI